MNGCAQTFPHRHLDEPCVVNGPLGRAEPIPVDPDEHCPDCGRLLDCCGRCSKHGDDRRDR